MASSVIKNEAEMNRLNDANNQQFTQKILWKFYSEIGNFDDVYHHWIQKLGMHKEPTSANSYNLMHLFLIAYDKKYKDMLTYNRLDSDCLDPPNDHVLKELIYDIVGSVLELPYLCVRIAQNTMILTGAGLCHLYLIYDGKNGKELRSVAHSVTCEDVDKDPKMIKLSNVVWDTKRGILGYVARTGEAIMIERMSLVRTQFVVYIISLIGFSSM